MRSSRFNLCDQLLAGQGTGDAEGFLASICLLEAFFLPFFKPQKNPLLGLLYFCFVSGLAWHEIPAVCAEERRKGGVRDAEVCMYYDV